MKRSTAFTGATAFFLFWIAVAIIGEYAGVWNPLPLSVELIGTSMGVALGLSIAEMAKSFTEEENEETIRRRNHPSDDERLWIQKSDEGSTC